MSEATIVEQLTLKDGLSDYGLGLRAAMRGYWQGVWSRFEFIDSMISTIQRGFIRAWHEGAAECGIGPDELSETEQAALQVAINSQFAYLLQLADFIFDNRRELPRSERLRWDQVMARTRTWQNRYEEVKNQARVMACKDRKGMWVLGEAEHCKSCLKLAGKVKRFSYWHDKQVLPRVADASYLECRGYLCQCSIVPTDASLSRGPLPNLP